MNREELAKQTMHQLDMHQSDFDIAFPEFGTVKSRFVYGEVWAHSELSIKQRLLVSIAALVTVQGEELLGMLHAALRNEVTPEELQEVFHQAAPYIGFAKAEKGLHVLKKAFDEAGVKLPLGKQSTVTEETRLESGISAQKALFGPVIDLMRANAPEDQRFMQDYLSAFCFGDTYTRGALDLKTRELLTFVCIISLGGCDSQAKAHVGGNLMAGNGKTVLVSAAAQCLPYIGFPRTLNALAAISEMTKPKEEAK